MTKELKTKFISGILLILFSTFTVYAQLPADALKGNFLKYLNKLHSGTEQRIITSQFCSWGPYSDFREIETVFSKSGQWLGFLGVDYHGLDMTTKQPPMLAKNYTNPNSIIFNYGIKICNMSMHLNNPFCDSSAWSRYGNLKLLFDINSMSRKNLEAQWDTISTGIKQLQDSGVVVMLRPYHEMNGNWFWWGQMGNSDTQDFKKLWRLTYHYFTKVKKLKNVIWCYSPFCWPHQYLNEYPGSDVVDVVCVDYYDSSLKEWLKLPYDALLTLNKPIGIGEYGCLRSSDWFWEKKQIHDFSSFVSEIRQFPKIGFITAWNLHWGFSYHKGLEMLNNPIFINKSELQRILDTLQKN